MQLSAYLLLKTLLAVVNIIIIIIALCLIGLQGLPGHTWLQAPSSFAASSSSSHAV